MGYRQDGRRGEEGGERKGSKTIRIRYTDGVREDVS